MFVSLGDFKRFLGISRVEEDGRLLTALKGAFEDACRYAGRRFIYGNYVEYFDSNGQSVFYLKETPIKQVVNVFVDRTSVFGEDTKVEDYFIETNIGELILDVEAPVGYRVVKVEYLGGYGGEGAEPPADLKEAIMCLGAFNYLGMVASNVSVESKNDREQYKNRAYEILDRYKVVFVC